VDRGFSYSDHLETDEEMTPNLANVLKSLGLSKLTPSVHWCRAKELIHVVAIHKARCGETNISALVWSSSLLSEGEVFSPAAIQSPICASVSPRGMTSSWSWRKDDIDPEHVASILRSFFRQFATLDDIRAALEDSYVTPFFVERLANGKPRLEIEERVSSQALYEVRGGALGRNRINELARAFLGEILAKTDYAIAKTEDVVAIKPRKEEMLDCVRLIVDEFGTFAVLVCFPWTTKVWSVDKRWKGTYYPMLPHYVGSEDRPMLFDLLEEKNADPERLRVLIDDCAAKFSEISDIHAFAALLDSQWSAVALGLRRIPLP
jgi:hypothetical protein